MKRQTTRTIAGILLFLVMGLGLSRMADAATITVNSTADNTVDDAFCTLREAIISANLDNNLEPDCVQGSGSDTIQFSVTGTITLGSALSNIIQGLTITGPGVSSLTIDAGSQSWRVLNFDSAGDDQLFSVSGLTITGGRPGAAGGGISLNQGDTLTVDSCIITANETQAGNFGAGIYNNRGTLTVTNSTISNNTTSGVGAQGGGIYVEGGSLTLTNSAVTGNQVGGGDADDEGGGIYITETDTVVITNSTISGNTASLDGGGIRYAPDGASDRLYLNSVTITNNSAGGDGGGLYDPTGRSRIRNSIIAGNTDTSSSAPDCVAGAEVSAGYNLIGDSTGCSYTAGTGDQVGTTASPINPQLTALANNGGSTSTHALGVTSSAIDAGDPAGCKNNAGSALNTDQRGQARFGRCDIGAFEYQGSCGDGLAQTTAGEGCDDGNTSNTDSCLTTCVSATCGDGNVQASVEACDDGNTSNTDSCLTICVSATCGDGSVQTDVEACDDGASNSDTTADACRSTCVSPACGDEIIDTGEGCDDGNTTDGDGCSASCAVEESGELNGGSEGDGENGTSGGGCSLVR